ncbi:hypothetical protein BGZ79_010680, partial [Entomortierella chlamydospora]
MKLIIMWRDTTPSKSGCQASQRGHELHDSARRVMVGTVGWNALATLAVVVRSGKIVVGPHNSLFQPHEASHVWLRKDGGEDLHNNVERHTRSKFDKDLSYKKFATTHPRFLDYCTLPVTLTTLWEFKSNTKGAWPGIKVAAHVFYQLHKHGKILKSDVMNCLQMLRVEKGRTEETTGIVGNLNRLVEIMT